MKVVRHRSGLTESGVLRITARAGWQPNALTILSASNLKAGTPVSGLSLVLNLSVFVLILGVHFHMFRAIRLSAFAGMFALVISSLLNGWVLGESGRGNRRTMGFSTSVRSVAVSLVIATGSFPGPPAVTAGIGIRIVPNPVLALLALLWGRLETMREPIADSFTVSPSGTDQVFEQTKP